ncbi:MAG TPA: GAF domain-containing protein [Polyangiaceae bacterium]|nr:GAF domain-containing protein [Polyangiaceae bacterium]
MSAPKEPSSPSPETPFGPHDAPARARIHVRGGEGRLDAVLDFVAFAARPMPLLSLLDEAPRRLATIFGADVVSLYLLEGDGDTLVLRGNVGFEGRGLGQVRLKVGEGITGTAVEVMRPISVVTAPSHQGYRHFPELGEERFPIFAVVPILGRRGALGAVAMQRRGPAPFGDADVELLTALAAAVAAGVRAAELIDSMRERHSAAERRAGGGTRKITLSARPVVPGRALGAVAGLKRPPSRPREARGGGDDAARLKAAFDVVGKALRALIGRAHGQGLGRDADFLETYALIVSDARLKAEALRRCERGMGVAAALDDIARYATRSAAVEGIPFLEDRARDIEDLCDALAMIAATDPRAELPSRAVLVANRLTVFDVLVSARSRPVGVALAERADGPRMRVLLTLLGLPTVVDVDGLFRWVSDGDIALVDADHGLLVVNPSKSEVAGLRKARRDKGSAEGGGAGEAGPKGEGDEGGGDEPAD